jgi:hypothetical protein
VKEDPPSPPTTMEEGEGIEREEEVEGVEGEFAEK